MLVVLDANTLASAAVAPAGGVLATLIDAWRDGDFDVAVSLNILDELERTFSHPCFAGRLASDDITSYLRFIRSSALVTPLTVSVRGIDTHPEDDLVLATAVSARAEFLVTGDGQLRKLGTHATTIILSPREFLSLLEDFERSDRHQAESQLIDVAHTLS